MRIDELRRRARKKFVIGIALLALVGYLLWSMLPGLRIGRPKSNVSLFGLFNVPENWCWIGMLVAVLPGFALLRLALSDWKTLAASKRRVRDRQLDEEHRSRGL